MKKLNFYFAFAILGIFTGIISCSEKNVEPKDLKAEFEKSAELHTEVMERIYSALTAEQSLSKDKLLNITETVTLKFISDNNSAFQNMGEAADICESERKRLEVYKMAASNQFKLDGEVDFLYATIKEYESHLTEGQIELLLKVHNTLLSSNDPEIIVTNLREIKDIDCLALPPEERNYIYAATTIGIESIIYWSENLDDWYYVVSSNDADLMAKNAQLKGWFNWKDVGNEDISGAIGGAVGGAIVGSVAGGVGAVPGAAAGCVAGGIGSSATSAVRQLIDHYF